MSDGQRGETTDEHVRDWWSTEIIEMEPGVIRYRGYPIEQLIGNVSFAQTVWLLLRGDLPSPAEARLLDAVLMSAVDHGPQAPSIAIARMAATCGVGLNNAIASAVNVLGDVHGGAGEQAVELYLAVDRERGAGAHRLADGPHGLTTISVSISRHSPPSISTRTVTDQTPAADRSTPSTTYWPAPLAVARPPAVRPESTCTPDRDSRAPFSGRHEASITPTRIRVGPGVGGSGSVRTVISTSAGPRAVVALHDATVHITTAVHVMCRRRSFRDGPRDLITGDSTRIESTGTT